MSNNVVLLRQWVIWVFSCGTSPSLIEFYRTIGVKLRLRVIEILLQNVNFE